MTDEQGVTSVSSDPRETPRCCAAPGCRRSLEGVRADAVCCSPRCRLRLHRHRQRAAALGQDDYQPIGDYLRRARDWDPAAELARVRALDLRPAAAEVGLVDPAERLRGRAWRSPRQTDPADTFDPPDRAHPVLASTRHP